MSAININSENGYVCRAPVVALSTKSFNSWAVRRLCVQFCFALIGFVSILDMYFVWANSDILNSEQNPVCLALMKLEPDSKMFFFIAKSIGSIAVLLTLGYLLTIRYRHATTVLLSVAVFQAGLLSYLCLGDSQIGGCPNFALLFQDTPESIFRLKQ